MVLTLVVAVVGSSASEEVGVIVEPNVNAGVDVGACACAVVVAVAVAVGKAIEVEVAGVRAVLNENDVGAIAGLGTATTF